MAIWLLRFIFAVSVYTYIYMGSNLLNIIVLCVLCSLAGFKTFMCENIMFNDSVPMFFYVLSALLFAILNISKCSLMTNCHQLDSPKTMPNLQESAKKKR